MRLFGNLQKKLMEQLFDFIAGTIGAKNAVRLIAVGTLATIYISCVVVFTTMIAPWLAGVFETAYGALLGLLFPPISGSVIASIMVYRTCVVGVRYTSALMKMAISGGR
jgi:hypothetical protein